MTSNGLGSGIRELPAHNLDTNSVVDLRQVNQMTADIPANRVGVSTNETISTITVDPIETAKATQLAEATMPDAGGVPAELLTKFIQDVLAISEHREAARLAQNITTARAKLDQELGAESTSNTVIPYNQIFKSISTLGVQLEDFNAVVAQHNQKQRIHDARYQQALELGMIEEGADMKTWPTMREITIERTIRQKVEKIKIELKDRLENVLAGGNVESSHNYISTYTFKICDESDEYKKSYDYRVEHVEGRWNRFLAFIKSVPLSSVYIGLPKSPAISELINYAESMGLEVHSTNAVDYNHVGYSLRPISQLLQSNLYKSSHGCKVFALSFRLP